MGLWRVWENWTASRVFGMAAFATVVLTFAVWQFGVSMDNESYSPMMGGSQTMQEAQAARFHLGVAVAFLASLPLTVGVLRGRWPWLVAAAVIGVVAVSVWSSPVDADAVVQVIPCTPETPQNCSGYTDPQNGFG